VGVGRIRVKTLPTFASLCDRAAAAETRDGWLCACEDAGRFLALSRELVARLADWLRALSAGPVLEVCSGSGELSEALRAAGVSVVATDAAAPAGSGVRHMPAHEALARYRPDVVLGCFVPGDALVDEAVLRFPGVEHYVVLGARIGGVLGSAALWRHPRWTARPLAHVARWMLTRHDVWIGDSDNRILQHGEAWHFRRAGSSRGDHG